MEGKHILSAGGWGTVLHQKQLDALLGSLTVSSSPLNVF